MNSASEQQVKALEQAILDRAEELADELSNKAAQQRDNLLRESNERLRLAEERETRAAQAAAERAQRRQVQANELRQQGQLDQLRWELVLAVQSRLAERMRQLREDRNTYLPWLECMVAEAASMIPDGELLAEVNAEDHQWLESEWEGLISRAAPGRQILLNPQPTWGEGGVKIRSADNRAQVDNRFEGRLLRYEADIQRAILQQLFGAQSINAGAVL